MSLEQGGSDRDECHHSDDSLRDHAIETPDLQEMRLDVGEIEGEGQPDQARGQQQAVETQQRESAEQGVAGDPDCGHWYMVDHGEAAMVHDAAVPLFVDAAGLNVGRVMDVQRHAGYDDSAYREKADDETHGVLLERDGC